MDNPTGQRVPCPAAPSLMLADDSLDARRGYLDSAKRIGAFGNICSDEEHELFLERGVIESNPVQGAEDILIMEQIREMLISEPLLDEARDSDALTIDGDGEPMSYDGCGNLSTAPQRKVNRK